MIFKDVVSEKKATKEQQGNMSSRKDTLALSPEFRIRTTGNLGCIPCQKAEINAVL